jgi:hypothetical protein
MIDMAFAFGSALSSLWDPPRTENHETSGASGAKYPCFPPNRKFRFPARRKKSPARSRREFCWNDLETLGFLDDFTEKRPK